MDCLEAIKIRRSIREYKDKPIPKELLEKIVDAGRFAPTARGEEPWEFIIITDSEDLKKIGNITDHGKFISRAFACIAVFCKETKYYLEDGCAATQNLMLAATAFGIGSCWVAGDKKPYCTKINDLLNVPASFKLVSLIALGYPKADDTFKVANKRKIIAFDFINNPIPLTIPSAAAQRYSFFWINFKRKYKLQILAQAIADSINACRSKKVKIGTIT